MNSVDDKFEDGDKTQSRNQEAKVWFSTIVEKRGEGVVDLLSMHGKVEKILKQFEKFEDQIKHLQD